MELEIWAKLLSTLIALILAGTVIGSIFLYVQYKRETAPRPKETLIPATDSIEISTHQSQPVERRRLSFG